MIIDCYNNVSLLNYWKLCFSTFSPSYMRMVARRNRLNDYKWLFYHKDHLLLHKKLTEHVILGAERWSGYDYGEGYFYQSCKQIGITGFRDTEARIKQIDLLHHTAGKTVLEIGCNSGFIAIAAMTGLSCITHTTPPTIHP